MEEKCIGKMTILAVFEYSISHREFTYQILPPR